MQGSMVHKDISSLAIAVPPEFVPHNGDSVRACADRIANVGLIGRQHVRSFGSRGPLGHDGLTVRTRHGIDHVGVPHQRLGERLRLMAAEVQAHLGQ